MSGVVHAVLGAAMLIVPAQMPPGEHGSEFVVDGDGAVTPTLPLSDCAEFVRDIDQVASLLGGRGGLCRG